LSTRNLWVEQNVGITANTYSGNALGSTLSSHEENEIKMTVVRKPEDCREVNDRIRAEREIISNFGARIWGEMGRESMYMRWRGG
jgi:hypothetical protein